jgi:hypothetical protein
MFDTLKHREISLEEALPGDLVFYEATFFPGVGKKLQKHDIVHVEVLTEGGGSARTIGSRFQTGVVSEFDSYVFKSTIYEVRRHYFLSIGPWLEGECVSRCEEHRWEINRPTGSKYSIFASTAAQELGEDEQCCGDD